MATLHLVSKWDLDRLEPHLDDLRGLIEKFVAAWPLEVTFESVCNDVNKGNCQLWAAFEKGRPIFIFIGMLQTLNASGRKRYEIKYAAGEMKLGELGLMEDIERYAAKRGAEEIEMTTLPGLRRVLKERGYVTALEVVKKKLGDFHG